MLEARTAAVSARSLSSRLSETESILLRRAAAALQTFLLGGKLRVVQAFCLPPCLSALLERSKNVSHRSLFEPWTRSSPARRLLPTISLVRHPRERAGARERAGEAREKPSYLEKKIEKWRLGRCYLRRKLRLFWGVQATAMLSRIAS